MVLSIVSVNNATDKTLEEGYRTLVLTPFVLMSSSTSKETPPSMSFRMTFKKKSKCIFFFAKAVSLPTSTTHSFAEMKDTSFWTEKTTT